MLATLTTIASVAGTVLTSIIAVLAVLAPLTKSTLDNRALDALRWVEDKLLSLILPGLLKASDLGVSPPPSEPAPHPSGEPTVTPTAK